MICIGLNVNAQLSTLRNNISNIAKDAQGTVGISIINLDTRDTLSFNGNSKLPMQSVMKFPIAITVLHAVDQHKLALNQLIHITKNDLPKTYSPLGDKFPNGNVDISISELLSYMVSLSDNNACDILLKVLGGPEKAEAYMHQIGIKNIAIKASEAQMATAWNVQFNNWCEPNAIAHLLDISFKSNFLSKSSHAYLWQIMQATSTGPNQIKGLLPKNTVVYHKTGRSGTNAAGITAATNDVGIITLPNGKHVAVAIFISNSKVDLAMRESVIARIAKAVYDNAIE
ncbi:class A beta-lactamase, subclass A2 [Mucilaginibacter terrae]|uniref:class A beta-lactamase, subclass A2 n=1 Tax=Mucilaginibacter terrae TaxID=1955052 RepID=UPI00366A7B02